MSRLFFLLLFFLSHKYSVEQNPDKILKDVSDKLNSLTSIQYSYNRDIHYYDENYHAASDGLVYIEFPKEDLSSLKFQGSSKQSLCVFNGTNYFALDDNKKTISIETKRAKQILESSSYLYNSIYTLKNFLPHLISNSSIQKNLKDTLVDNQSCWKINFELFNEYVGNLGDIKKFTKEYTGDPHKPYTIIIDQRSLLPVGFISRFKDKPDNIIAAKYKDININPAAPKEQSWFYSSYAGYKSPDAQKPLVKAGEKMMNWQLPLATFNGADSVYDVKNVNKPMLIEFWIKNCGYCMAAFPVMSDWAKKYPELQLISINTEDEKSDVLFFRKKHQPSYPMLYQGNALREQLGVSSFPTVLLIDKNGKIVYAGSLIKEDVEAQLKKLMK